MPVSFSFKLRGEVRDRLRVAFFFVLLAGAFSVATVAANAYHSERAGLAKRWFLRGEAAVQAKLLDAAVVDYRNALAYDRDNQQVQLRLAQALTQLHRYSEAQYYLLGLWEREPGRGTVNLQLARLSAAQGDYPSAMRYYHNAVFGVWETNSEEARRNVRFELVRYLLNQGMRTQADAELIGLVDKVPDTAPSHQQLGQLFLRTEDYPRALDHFQTALRMDRNSDEALLGAGEAAFQLRRYSVAERYLRRALRLHPENVRAGVLTGVLDQMEELNPYSYRLSGSARAQRVIKSYETANARLAACSAQNPNIVALQTLQQQSDGLKDVATQSKLRRDPANIDAVMNLVFSVERLTALQCGKPNGADYALLLIGQQREAMEQ